MRYIVYVAVITCVSWFGITGVARAQTGAERGFGEQLTEVSEVTGYKDITNPAETLPLYIALLVGWTGFIGINMLIQVVLGGYEYMTAYDNAEKIVKAKKRIRNTVYAAIILVGGYILVAGFVGVLSLITSYQG